jgi:hypothetical protein
METLSEADKLSWLMGALKPHPALYAVINHMGIVQGVTNAVDVSFYNLVEMISNQATLLTAKIPRRILLAK